MTYSLADAAVAFDDALVVLGNVEGVDGPGPHGQGHGAAVAAAVIGDGAVGAARGLGALVGRGLVLGRPGCTVKAMWFVSSVSFFFFFLFFSGSLFYFDSPQVEWLLPRSELSTGMAFLPSKIR